MLPGRYKIREPNNWEPKPLCIQSTPGSSRENVLHICLVTFFSCDLRFGNACISIRVIFYLNNIKLTIRVCVVRSTINNPVHDFAFVKSVLKSICVLAQSITCRFRRVRMTCKILFSWWITKEPTFETETRKLTIPIQTFLCGRRSSADQSKNGAGNQSVKRFGRLINFTANPNWRLRRTRESGRDEPLLSAA